MSFIYKEEDQSRTSRVILRTEGDEFVLELQRKNGLPPQKIFFQVKKDGVRLAASATEFLLMYKAMLAMQMHEITQKLSPEFEIEEYFERYMRDVYKNLRRKPVLKAKLQEQELLREFYSTLDSEDIFAKRKNMTVTTFRSLRLRYSLPSKGTLVKVSNKAARALGFGKKNYLCKHKDCWPCRLVERRLNRT